MLTPCCHIWRQAWPSAFSAPLRALGPALRWGPWRPTAGRNAGEPLQPARWRRLAPADATSLPDLTALGPRCPPPSQASRWIGSTWLSSRCAVKRPPANGAPPHGAKPPPHTPQAPLALAECNPLVPWAPAPFPLGPCVILRRLARRATGGRRGENGCSASGIAGGAAWKDIAKLLYCGNGTGA